jgi:signal peptidase I
MKMFITILTATILFVSAAFSQELRLTEYDATHRLAKIAAYHDNIIPVANTGSMRPFLDERCITLVRKISWSQLKTGDIVIFEKDGSLIGHRIVRRQQSEIVTEGDANIREDLPVSEKTYRGAVVAVFTFDPRFPDTITQRMTREEGLILLRMLTDQNHLTESEAKRMAKSHLRSDETIFTVRATGDNVKRSEQCVYIAKTITDPSLLSKGDLVTIKMSAMTKFFRVILSHNDSIARRILSVKNGYAYVHREGSPNQIAKVQLKNITHLIVGCVLFNERNDTEDDPIFLE